MSNIISGFRGKYFFLSNFFPCFITYKGHTYTNAEAAFQAQKCIGREVEFEKLSAKDAKILGKHVKLRPDWDSIKIELMFQVLVAKFADKTLKAALKATRDSILVETNTWHDTFWGVYQGQGENHLGLLLMYLRSKLQ